MFESLIGPQQAIIYHVHITGIGNKFVLLQSKQLILHFPTLTMLDTNWLHVQR